MAKQCSNCYNAVLADYGWSNWTVEGTSVYCSKKLHPSDGFDRWYGENKEDAFAEQCPAFTKGKPVHMDVDREDLDSLKADELRRYKLVFPG